MNFVILGLLVVLLIGYFVVVWKAAGDWRWYQLVAVCIMMPLAVAFLFPTAMVLKSRSAWHKIKEELEVRAATVQADNRIIKYGDPANPEEGEGIVALDQRLAKLGIEAGRRWRNMRLQNVANNNIILADVGGAPVVDDGLPVDPAVAPAPAPTQPLIPEDLVVYGFAETPNAQQVLVPTFYMGEFRVSASTPTQVTLIPTGPLEPVQLQRINNQQAPSWSLYELLPLDGHEPFMAEGSVTSDDQYFGRVDDDLVKRILGNRVTPETLDEYTRDGERATQDDPPLSRWTKIEFTQDYAIEVDSPEQRGALDGGFFDGNGRAVDGRLQRGDDGKVRFKREDQILVKEEAADQLINEGVAELRDTYFIRPLNDYRYVLRRIRLRLTELANRTTELEYEKKTLEEAIQKTEGMIVDNQVIKDKLEQDVAQFSVEAKAITNYTGELKERVDTMRKEMSRLHQSNLALEQEIEKRHLAIERRLDAYTVAP